MQEHSGNLIRAERWLEGIGRSSTTLWRWRKRGWVTTVSISGKLYISHEEIRRFERRAAAGEFIKGSES